MSDTKNDMLPFVQVIVGLLPVMTAILGGLWVIWKYLDDRNVAARRDYMNSFIGARKPFLGRKLDSYAEVAKTAGKLLTLEANETEWKDAHKRFYQLFWTELSMVEDDNVKQAMQDFSAQLKQFDASPNDVSIKQELEQRAYRLARSLRESIAKDWDVKLGNVGEEKLSIGGR